MPGIVGREAQLTETEGFLAASTRGFAVLVVEGEAGIGKTTLLREARDRAQANGALVLWSRPSPAEAKLSLVALGDLLAPIDEQAFAALPEPQRHALEVALLRRAPDARRPLARAIAAGFLTLIRGLAVERPVILAIDDWQWLDVQSMRALEFAARRLERERIGLVCSIRSPHSGSPTVGIAEERITRVELGPLSLAALGRIISGRLGRPLPRPYLVRVARASGGNPFYALEIARLAREQGLPGAAGADLVPVPDDLRKLTAARIRRLPAAAREAVLVAAVISGPDRRTVDLDALVAAEQSGIVTIDEAGRIEFAHPLFASAAYGSLPASSRRRLHRRAADLVAEPEQRARQLALASTAPDPAVASRLDQGAATAAGRGATDAAAELAELAARLTPVADGDARGRRLLAAARFQFEAGDLARAEDLATAALAELPAGSRRAGALQTLAQLHGRRNNFSQAAGLAAQALAAAGDDERMRAAIELELTYCASGLADMPAAVEHGRRAVAHAEASGDDAVLASALAGLTIAAFLGGRGLDREQIERALALPDPIDAPLVLRPRLIDGVLSLWMGDTRGALDRLGALRDETHERGQEGSLPQLLLYMVQAALWRGRVDEAAGLADEAREAAALLDDPTATAIALGAQALVHAHYGEVEIARRDALASLRLFEGLEWRFGAIWALWALGFLELSLGDPAAVDRVLGPPARQLTAVSGDPCVFVFLPDEIEALIALGEHDAAEAYLAPFERLADRHDRTWAVAVAARCRGALEAARGARGEALAAFDRALDAHALAGMPFERARTELLAGETHRRFKQRAAARALLGRALSTFESIGVPLWAARARAALERVGGPSVGGDPLTGTERRIAELAASGLSNREIADRAYLSIKTVESNLTRVYRKLGVRSRVGLANALRDRVEELPRA